jgi:sarcosine dehydrogenase
MLMRVSHRATLASILGKEITFLGGEAMLAQKPQPSKKRLACFTVDSPDIFLLGRETIYRDGERVGWLSSRGWGYTVSKNIGFGYVRHAQSVDDALLASGRYELEVSTERTACSIHLEPLYDPHGDRVKG